MFSIIMPAYNAEKFIKDAIKSVLSQRYFNFELIIVDDGSKDKTAEVIKSFKDKRIHYLYQNNAGVSAARNLGISEAKGEYICFLDSDDEWRENHLDVLIGLIEKYKECSLFVTGYDICLTDGKLIPKSKEILNKVKDEDFQSDDGYGVLLNYGYFLNTNTVCCKKEVFDKVGLFRVGVKNSEDDDMWMRIFAHYSLAISKESTTIYNRSNSSATNKRKITKDIFLERVDDILTSSEVTEKRKQSLIRIVERKKISRARKYILIGNKKEAYKLLFNTNTSLVSKKKYAETLIALFLPYKLTRMYIDKRDKGYYKK